MDAACAEESWVWLYVLLAIVIPTSLGFVMGLVKTGLNLVPACLRVLGIGACSLLGCVCVRVSTPTLPQCLLTLHGTSTESPLACLLPKCRKRDG